MSTEREVVDSILAKGKARYLCAVRIMPLCKSGRPIHYVDVDAADMGNCYCQVCKLDIEPKELVS